MEMLVNICLLGWAETMGRRVDPDFRRPIFFADISGDSSILGTSPLSKSFGQLEEGQSFFLSLLVS